MILNLDGKGRDVGGPGDEGAMWARCGYRGNGKKWEVTVSAAQKNAEQAFTSS